MQTIIIGLGNPIVGDDAIGCRIVEELEKRLNGHSTADSITIEPFYRGGIALMERLIDYDRAIIIDSIQGMGGEIGSIYEMSLDDLPTLTANSPHDTSLKSAIEFGKKIGAKLPEDVKIIAVEIHSDLTVSEELSPPVEAAIEPVLNMVNQLL